MWWCPRLIIFCSYALNGRGFRSKNSDRPCHSLGHNPDQSQKVMHQAVGRLGFDAVLAQRGGGEVLGVGSDDDRSFTQIRTGQHMLVVRVWPASTKRSPRHRQRPAHTLRRCSWRRNADPVRFQPFCLDHPSPFAFTRTLNQETWLILADWSDHPLDLPAQPCSLGRNRRPRHRPPAGPDYPDQDPGPLGSGALEPGLRLNQPA